MLRLILDMLVDHPEQYKEDEIRTLLEKANMITPSILAGTATRKAASKEVMLAMGAVLGGTFAAGAMGAIASPLLAGGAAGAWLVKAIASGKKK